MNELLKKILKELGIEITPEVEKKFAPLIEELKKDGIEEGKKISVDGRVKRELKAAEEKLKKEYELEGSEVEELKNKLKDFEKKEFNNSVKEKISALGFKVKDKYFEDVITKSGITSETDEKEYKKLLEKTSKEYEEFFGEVKNTLNFGDITPAPTITENMGIGANGEIDESKIKDPAILQMVEESRR